MDLIVSDITNINIDGRKILPIRLIPFLISSKVEVDQLVRWLGNKDEDTQIPSFQLLPNSYQLTNDYYWNFYAREIQAFKVQYPGGWQNFAHKALPPATFVWFDEFECHYTLYWVSVNAEDVPFQERTLNANCVIPHQMRQFILEGFETKSIKDEDDYPSSTKISLPFCEQRELSKVETLKKHNSWFEMHNKLKKDNRRLSGRKIADEIAKMSIAEGATSETIRTTIRQFKKHHVKKSPQSPF